MNKCTVYYDLPNGERIELSATMPEIEEVPGPLSDGEFGLPEAVKEMFKWADEMFGTWESDFSSFKIWTKSRKNFSPPERWEVLQDKRRNPIPLGRNTYLFYIKQGRFKVWQEVRIPTLPCTRAQRKMSSASTRSK